MNLQTIEKDMMGGQLSPRQVSEYGVVLGGHISFLSEKLKKIKLRRPFVWAQIRKEHKSDKAADRAWESTEDGQEEIRLEFDLKRLQEMKTALGRTLRILEKEAQKLW